MKNVKIFTDMIEESATKQIAEISQHPAFQDAKIRIMPDVHAGKGCVCGFTADLGDKVVPNLIGVDIGCGMLTVPLGKVELDLGQLDEVIRKVMPSGKNIDTRPGRYLPEFGDCNPRSCNMKFSAKDLEYFDKSIGTLGGGNHFVECDIDDDGNKYLIIHCGSRKFGKEVCDRWQQRAVELIVRGIPSFRDMVDALKAKGLQGEELGKEIEKAKAEWMQLRDKAVGNADLAYLVGEDREGYIHDMKIAQRWAMLNRYTIACNILRKFDMLEKLDGCWTTVHNYLGEDNIIRKSAISAKKGEQVLIPLNMRDGSIIAVGKGNDDWNCSAPHGAGRLMSRAAAKKQISFNDFKKSMDGIFTTSVSSATIDEAPMAYKPAAKILEQIADTVEVVKVIKPIYNFKAAE